MGALSALSTKGVKIISVSGLWQSPAWPPGQGHPDYLNAAAQVGFQGSAEELLGILNQIEAEFGRVRSERNAPRILDLDILDFKGQRHGNAKLTLPHPRMLSRGFVLLPLQQIAPEWRDPATGLGISDHIARLPLSDIAPMKYVGRFYGL